MHKIKYVESNWHYEVIFIFSKHLNQTNNSYREHSSERNGTAISPETSRTGNTQTQPSRVTDKTKSRQ